MPAPPRGETSLTERRRADLSTWSGDTRRAVSAHAGTHADASLHAGPDGAAIDVVPLEPCTGPARPLDLRGRGRVITPGPLQLLSPACQRLAHHAWTEDLVTFVPETIALPAAPDVLLIGTDPPLIDSGPAGILLWQDAAHAAGLPVLEGLVIEAVEPGDDAPITLPIGLGGLDAATVRTVLRALS